MDEIFCQNMIRTNSLLWLSGHHFTRLKCFPFCQALVVLSLTTIRRQLSNQTAHDNQIEHKDVLRCDINGDDR